MSDAAPAGNDKPAILRESRFTVEEGLAYRAARTGAIWMNKLFFSSVVLALVWVGYGAITGNTGCVAGLPNLVTQGNQTVDQGTRTACNVFLTPTFGYLAAMAVVSFALSMLFGVLGLVVGKRILESTPAAEEVGAGPGPEKNG